MTRFALLFSMVALASACGSAAATPETTTPAATPAADTTATPAAASDVPPPPANVEGPPQAWATMTGEQKGHWMAEHVMPTMQPLFQAYDATRYADFSCATCHGPNARETHFAMPTPAIAVLPGPTSSEWPAYMGAHQRMIQFMGGTVEHTMAALVGEAPYDPATQAGFGCYECHTHN